MYNVIASDWVVTPGGVKLLAIVEHVQPFRPDWPDGPMVSTFTLTLEPGTEYHDFASVNTAYQHYPRASKANEIAY